jgi:hypothetical protein
MAVRIMHEFRKCTRPGPLQEASLYSQASPTGVPKDDTQGHASRSRDCLSAIAPGFEGFKVSFHSTRGVHSLYKCLCKVLDPMRISGGRSRVSKGVKASPFIQALYSHFFCFFPSFPNSFVWTSTLPSFKPGNGCRANRRKSTLFPQDFVKS